MTYVPIWDVHLAVATAVESVGRSRAQSWGREFGRREASYPTRDSEGEQLEHSA